MSAADLAITPGEPASHSGSVPNSDGDSRSVGTTSIQRRRCYLDGASRGHQEMDGENEEVALEANGNMTIVARRTAPHGRAPSYYEFSTHRTQV